MAIKTDYKDGDLLKPGDVNDVNSAVLTLQGQVAYLQEHIIQEAAEGVSLVSGVLRADVDTNTESAGVKLILPVGAGSKIGVDVTPATVVETGNNKLVTSDVVAQAVVKSLPTWGEL